MPMTLPASNNAPFIGAKLKAWARFQGVAANGAATIIASSNIASITRSGASGTIGYDFVFTNALTDGRYVVIVRGEGGSSATAGGLIVQKTNNQGGVSAAGAATGAQCNLQFGSVTGALVHMIGTSCVVEFWE